MKHTYRLNIKNINKSQIYNKIADVFGTPIYVYSAEKIKHSYQKLHNAMGSDVDIYYSMKANPNISICKLLAKQGAGLEVCSTFELLAALKTDIDPQKIIFVGPLKRKEDIAIALDNNIYAIACESFEEIDLIQSMASNRNMTARVMLRINPSFSAKNALLKMGGKPSQFGIDDTQAIHAIEKMLASTSLHLLGIHVYNGTRILNYETLAENTAAVLSLADEIQEKFNVKFDVIDFGGGAGIPYFSHEQELDMDSLKGEMIKLFANFKNKYKKIKLIMESGRYLVGESGRFITKVYSIKTSKNEEFAVTDGGTNCHMAAVGIGSLIRSNFPISVIAEYPVEEKFEYNLTGPLCTPNDLIGKAVKLQKLKVGDLISVEQSGAYGPTASPVYFLSHGFPNEVLYDENYAYLIRKADNAEDLFKNQVVIDI